MLGQNLVKTVTDKVFHTNSHDGPPDEQKVLQELAKEAVVAPYVEEEPSVGEWLWDLRPSRQGAVRYLGRLFPFVTWLPRYNWHWMLGDAIAGLTVGFVVVPQAMAYALLANLTPEYGLYTSFVGAAIYWLFGTSKDIVIGTTAVGSLLVGGVINTVQDQKPGVYTNEEIAKAISFLSGVLLIFLGLFRLGWIIELIPYVPISAFVTSASFTIIGTQLPTALGIRGIKTREAPYKVYINVLKGLPRAQLDAAIGLSSTALLWVLRDVFAKMEVRQPGKKRLWAMLSSLRLTFTMLLYTLISWLVHRESRDVHKFRLVGQIESGFKHAGVPKVSPELTGLVAPSLPAMVIILIIEHIAIAKSFGRKYGYNVIPSQEILAQGGANTLGTFVGGYACTGSFGASAVLTKAGVRTPLAGLFSAVILILALYALTSVFYYIPLAALAGLIIHAVANLMTPPSALYKYWRLAPFELVIWVIGVLVALFLGLEVSIYVTIALSFALLLVRMARSQGGFQGRVSVRRVVVHQTERDEQESHSSATHVEEEENGKVRDVYLPMEKQHSPNPRINVVAPYPGVFIYRFNEAFNYVNAAQHMDHLVSYVTENTRRTKSDDGLPLKDRLWSDPLPKRRDTSSPSTPVLPLLRAIVLDCSTINTLDITSIQGLIDARNTLDRYAAPALVEWHFAGLHNRWARRALAVAGFGHPVIRGSEFPGHWCPAYSVASSLAGATEEDKRDLERRSREVKRDEERKGDRDGSEETDSTAQANAEIEKKTNGLEPVHGVDRPFFHIDLTDAMDMAVRDAVKMDEMAGEEGCCVTGEDAAR